VVPVRRIAAFEVEQTLHTRNHGGLLCLLNYLFSRMQSPCKITSSCVEVRSDCRIKRLFVCIFLRIIGVIFFCNIRRTVQNLMSYASFVFYPTKCGSIRYRTTVRS